MNGGGTMFEKWLVFRHDGKEICAYTLRGTFPGERDETIKLLAHEKGIPAEEITCTIENRRKYPAGYPN